jgi:hypothetical protein
MAQFFIRKERKQIMETINQGGNEMRGYLVEVYQTFQNENVGIGGG